MPTFAPVLTDKKEDMQNTQNSAKKLALLGAGVVALFLWTCQSNTKNDNAKGVPAVEVNYPYERADSVFGFEGCDKGLYKADSAGAFEMVYAGYRVQVAYDPSQPGQQITVFVDSTGPRLTFPPLDEGGYFQGKWKNHFFVDVGTGPDVRKLNIYKVENGGLYQVFQTEYLSEEPPVVSQRGSLWFYGPVEEKDISEKPACPEAEQWRKEGLNVGYGQRRLYDMEQRMYTRKSEFICVPRQ